MTTGLVLESQVPNAWNASCKSVNRSNHSSMKLARVTWGQVGTNQILDIHKSQYTESRTIEHYYLQHTTCMYMYTCMQEQVYTYMYMYFILGNDHTTYLNHSPWTQTSVHTSPECRPCWTCPACDTRDSWSVWPAALGWPPQRSP